MREALIALIYWAEKDGYYSQKEIWNYTNKYSTTGKKDTTGHRFSDIPNNENLKLYIYESEQGYQNLLTIEGVLDTPYGGVKVQKTDELGNGLPGAEFTIYSYDPNNIPEGCYDPADCLEVAGTFTTGVDGKGGIYLMDSTQGLPLGRYILQETKAPRGYELNSWDYREFEITEDQQFQTIGLYGGDLVIENYDDGTTGGGISIKKVGSDGKTGLSGAEFDIFESTDRTHPVAHLITDADGRAMTGLRDLELDKTYVIVETKAPAGYQLDTTERTVDVTKDGEYAATVIIPNEERTRSKEISVTAEKKMIGTPSGETFTFELWATDKDGNPTGSEPLQTKTISGAGTVTFDHIPYNSTNPVSYVSYVVREKAGNSAGITYDAHGEFVTVLVTDNGDDDCSFIQIDDGDGVVFTNEAYGSLTVEKALAAGVDRSKLKAGLLDTQFTVLVEFSDAELNIPASDTGSVAVTNGKAELTLKIGDSVTLGKIPQGVTWTVSEPANSLPAGWSASGITNSTGTISGTAQTATVTNTYEATGSWSPAASKSLSGRALKANEFSFQLKQGNTVLQTKKNTAGGAVSFDPINYTLADVGQHVYTISEVGGDLGGVTYDSKVYTVTVNVTDNGDGHLNVSSPTITVGGTPAEAVAFANTYRATGSWTPSATKRLSGRDLVAGEFSFQLKNADGEVLQTKQNAADGTVTFDKIDYTLADVGEHVYTVVEASGTAGGVDYDTNVYTVTVNVTDNGDGHLNVTPTMKLGDVIANALSFLNTYSAEGHVNFEVNKVLNGRALANEQFEFELWAVDGEGQHIGDAPLQTKKNNAEGTVAFDTIVLYPFGCYAFCFVSVNHSVFYPH